MPQLTDSNSNYENLNRLFWIQTGKINFIIEKFKFIKEFIRVRYNQ